MDRAPGSQSSPSMSGASLRAPMLATRSRGLRLPTCCAAPMRGPWPWTPAGLDWPPVRAGPRVKLRQATLARAVSALRPTAARRIVPVALIAVGLFGILLIRRYLSEDPGVNTEDAYGVTLFAPGLGQDLVLPLAWGPLLSGGWLAWRPPDPSLAALSARAARLTAVPATAAVAGASAGPGRNDGRESDGALVSDAPGSARDRCGCAAGGCRLAAAGCPDLLGRCPCARRGGHPARRDPPAVPLHYRPDHVRSGRGQLLRHAGPRRHPGSAASGR
jgi:hypothetical protein